MKVQGQYRFESDREQVWRALQDPQVLADTLPGVRDLEVTGPDEYRISARAGVGSVKGVFDGTFRVDDKKDPESCTLVGSGRGAPGTAELEAQVRLRDDDGSGTLLEYEADATVTGKLAGVGQRMVASAARRTGEEFFRAVDDELRRREGDAADAGADEPAEQAAAPDDRPQATTGRTFSSRRAPRAGGDVRVYAAGVATGFTLAAAGVALGRWAGR